jgi:predicted PurR-regulated permease PerM
MEEPVPVQTAQDVSEAEATPSPPWSNSAKLAVASGLGVAILLLGYMVRSVFVTAALAGFVAFLIAPLIRTVHVRLKVPRGVALLIAYVLVLAGTLVFSVLMARAIIESVGQLDPVGAVVEIARWARENAEEYRGISVFGLDLDLSELVDSLQENLDTGELEESSGLQLTTDQVIAVIGGSLAALRSAVGVFAAIVMSGLVTLIVAMYLNADSVKYRTAIFRLVPPGYEGDALLMSQKLTRVWKGYLYGQLVNSLITGAMVWIVLWVVGMPGAFVMGVVMVVLNMIPTFGPILAAIPGVLAALVNGTTRFEMSNLAFAVLVAVIYLVVVQLQANLIAPRVMGTAVRLPPAVIMLGLIAGFAVGGLLGSLLAVPVIATLRDIFSYLYAKLIDRNPFPDRPPLVPQPQHPRVADAADEG